MAITRRQVLITGGLALVVTGVIVVVVTRRRNKELIKQINDILDKGTQATGTPEDIKNDDAFDPNFYKKNMGAIVSASAATTMAKKIHDAIGTFYDKETDVVSAITQIRTKTRLSFVSEIFLKKYGIGLGSFITERVDKGDNLKQIEKIVKNMPIK